jgi:hypothetical protein
MEVLVIPKMGEAIPGEWRAQGYEEMYVVTLGGETIAVFFNPEEAYAYAQWVEWRVEQQHKLETKESPSPGMRQ